MQIGTALIAPEGFKQLEPGLTYYFLYSSRLTRTVLLLLFAREKSRLLAHLYSLQRDAFERALNDRKIIQDNEHQIPDPFAVRQGHDLAVVDLQCRNPDKRVSDQERAQARLCQIAPLLERRDTILTSSDPVKEINKYAIDNRLKAQDR